MVKKLIGKYECGGEDALEKLPFPVLSKESGAILWDWTKYSEDVCKFLTSLRTKRLLRDHKESYENLIGNVDVLCKNNIPGASLKKPKGFLFKHGMLDKLIKTCKAYVQDEKDKEKDEDRKKKIKGFIIILKKARTDAVKDITDDGMNSGRTFKKDLDSERYKKIIIDGKLATQFQSGNDDYKFQDNQHLKEVTISNAVEKVPIGAFKNCKTLKKIVVDRRQKELVFDMESIVNCNLLQEIVVNNNDPKRVVFKKGAIKDCNNYKVVGKATFEK